MQLKGATCIFRALADRVALSSALTAHAAGAHSCLIAAVVREPAIGALASRAVRDSDVASQGPHSSSPWAAWRSAPSAQTSWSAVSPLGTARGTKNTVSSRVTPLRFRSNDGRREMPQGLRAWAKKRWPPMSPTIKPNRASLCFVPLTVLLKKRKGEIMGPYSYGRNHKWLRHTGSDDRRNTVYSESIAEFDRTKYVVHSHTHAQSARSYTTVSRH